MIKSNSTFAIFVKVELAYSAYLVAFVRQSSASLFLLCYRVTQVTCGMDADGGILQKFGELAERVGGWTELSVHIHKVLPEIGEHRNLDTSKRSRDKFKREIASLTTSKIRRLLEWGEVTFPSSSESSNTESEFGETAVPATNEPEPSVRVPPVSAPAPSSTGLPLQSELGQDPEEEGRLRRMTRALQRVLFDRDDTVIRRLHKSRYTR